MGQYKNADIGRDIRHRLQRVVEYKRKNLAAMIRQYLAAENMGFSSQKLNNWEEIIQFEKDELQNYVLLFENICSDNRI